MTLLGALRAAAVKPRLRAYASSYEGTFSWDAIAERQLSDLNAAWLHSLGRSPWAKRLQNEWNIPTAFDSWDSFYQRVPITNKSMLRPLLSNKDDAASGVRWLSTGGSTMEPFRFPIFADELRHIQLNVWLGRDWICCDVGAKVFLIWGHSHILGKGVPGFFRKANRMLKDYALGYARMSAYNLDKTSLRTYFISFCKHQPRYVVGLTSALERFVEANDDRSLQASSVGVDAVIATGESFSSESARRAVSKFFNCPVRMEYGTMETGPLAQEIEDSYFRVFWKKYRIEPVNDQASECNSITVTSLFPRALPLMRYTLGDRLRPSDDRTPIWVNFGAVEGRNSTTLKLPDGRATHSEALTHCIRDTACVARFQIVVSEGTWPRIEYEAPRDLSSHQLEALRARLARLHDSLGTLSVQRVSELRRTASGKQPVVFYENVER